MKCFFNHLALIFGIMLVAFSVEAVYLNSLIYDFEQKDGFLSIPVVNDTSDDKLYSISAYKIVKPGNGNEERVVTKELDLLWSPLTLTIPAGGKDFFKVFYRGNKDAREYYYRVVFSEMAMNIISFRDNGKATDVLPVVTVSALLIVRPDKIMLNYKIDEQRGVLKNTGNTFFRVILQNGCTGDDETAEQFYMLPGEVFYSKKISTENKKFLVGLRRYIPVGKGCFSVESLAIP